MRSIRLLIGIGLAAAAWPALHARQALPPTPTLTDQDYREIKALVARYVVGWDNAAPDDGGAFMGRAFQPDVIFLNAGGVRAGRKAVEYSAARSRPGLQHWTSNQLIDAAPGGAVGYSYVLLVTVDDKGGSPRITGGGVYRDVYEKTSDGWLIKRRIYDAVTNGEPPSWPWDTRVRPWEGTRPVRALKYDQVHFGVADPEKAVEWYREHIGGTRLQERVDPRVMLNGVRLIFLPVPNAKPSAGSVFDHVAFSVRDIDAKFKELQSAGARVVDPPHDAATGRTAMVDDPWGIRIELLHEPDFEGLHHVHLRVPDVESTMQWYVDEFGGETSRTRGSQGIRYGAYGNWLLMDTGTGDPSPGHAIDHLGWDTPDVKQTFTHLKSRGVTFINQPQTFGQGGAFFIEGLHGDKLELVQR